MGRPIPGIDEPLDENWWVRKKLREEGLSIVPPALEARRLIEKTLEELPRLANEAAVRKRLDELNEKVREAQRSPAAGPASGVAPVDVDAILARWRQERG